MPFTLLLTGHSWALRMAATVAQGHTRRKRGQRSGSMTTWVVEDNTGTEVSIVRLDRAGAGQQQAQFQVHSGAVILVLEGVLGNNGQRYGEGTIVCLQQNETFAPANSNPQKECWYVILWFQQPEARPPP